MEKLLHMLWNVELGCDTRDRSGEVLESCKSSLAERSKAQLKERDGRIGYGTLGR